MGFKNLCCLIPPPPPKKNTVFLYFSFFLPNMDICSTCVCVCRFVRVRVWIPTQRVWNTCVRVYYEKYDRIKLAYCWWDSWNCMISKLPRILFFLPFAHLPWSFNKNSTICQVHFLALAIHELTNHKYAVYYTFFS